MMSNINHEKIALFNIAFDALLNLNKSVRETYPDLLKDDADWRLYRDYATISFDPGQRTGKSVWATKFVSPADAVIVSHESFKDQYQTSMVYTQAEALDAFNRSVRYAGCRYVFVESGSWLDESVMEPIYKFFAHPKVTFVIIG